MIRFREEQRLRDNAVVRVALTLLGAVAAGWCWFFFATPPLGGRVRTWVGVQGIVLLAVLLWLWSARLEIELRSSEIYLRFRPLWFPKTIPYSRILRAESIRYRPILDFGGWGIRWGRAGWIWNAYGNRGVRLDLKGGKRFTIGSQQPDRLAESIEAARRE